MINIESITYKFQIVCDDCGEETLYEITEVHWNKNKNISEIIKKNENLAINSFLSYSDWHLVDCELYCPKCAKKALDILSNKKEVESDDQS